MSERYAHCINLHAMTDENSRLVADRGRIYWRCRECDREAKHRWSMMHPHTPLTSPSPITGRRMQAKTAARLEEYDWFTEAGFSFEEIAAKLEMSGQALEVALWRHRGIKRTRTWR